MKNIKNIFIGLLALAALAGLATHVYIRVRDSAPLPKFSFDSSKAADWSGSKNVNVQAVARSTAYDGEEPIDKLPIADMTIHHGTSSASIPADNCFVMYSYFNRTLSDTSAAYKDYVERKNELGGKIEEFDPLRQALLTFEGEKHYDLQQYRFIVEGKDTLQGYQIGFVPLSSGHVRVEGVCKTYENLALTLPVMASVELRDR